MSKCLNLFENEPWNLNVFKNIQHRVMAEQH